MARGFATGTAGVATIAVIGVALGGCCGRQRCAPCDGARPPQSTWVAEVSGEDSRGQVFLDTLVVRIPAAKAAEILGAVLPTDERPYRVLSAAEVEAAQRLWHHERGSLEIAAPKILVLPGKEARVFVGETYKADPQDLSYSDEGANWSGFKARGVATPSADLATVTLDFSYTMREPLPKDRKPDSTALASLAASEVFVEARGVQMKSGETLAVVPRPVGEGKDRVVVLVRATVLGAPGAAQAGP